MQLNLHPLCQSTSALAVRLAGNTDIIKTTTEKFAHNFGAKATKQKKFFVEKQYKSTSIPLRYMGYSFLPEHFLPQFTRTIGSIVFDSIV